MVTIEEINQTNSSSSSSSSSEEEDSDDYASKNTATERKRNRVVQGKVNFENDDHSDDDDDDDGSSSSRSEFEDDDQDVDNESDDEVHDKKIKVNDDQLRHIPISERLRHIQMEQGINQNYKEDRKRKHEQSQQVIQTVKEQILRKNQGRKNDDTNPGTKQSMNTNHEKSKKKSKHAPTLMSSKRSDFYQRQRLDLQAGGVSAIGTNIQAHTNVYKGRDPRSLIDVTTSSTNQSNNKRGGKKLLETIKGTSNSANQLEDYAFVQEMRNEEIQTLRKRIKARQITGRKGQEQRRRYNVQNTDSDGLIEDQRELHRLQQEKATYERHQLDVATKRAVQARLRESNPKRQRDDTDEAEVDIKAAQDHAPAQSSKYVPKVRELKRMYMETKYDLISQQRQGKNTIDKMILKKHKRNKSKDSKKHHL